MDKKIKKTIFYHLFMDLIKKFLDEADSEIYENPIAIGFADYSKEPLTAFLCFGFIDQNKKDIIKNFFTKPKTGG